MTQTPQDILELIVDEVLDRTTLKSLALVSKRFAQMSQRRLFHSISHYNVGTNEKLFLNGVISNPEIAQYIREFDLSFHNLGPGSADSGQADLSKEYSIVLNLLRNITKLKLMRIHDWEELSDDMREALHEVLLRPTLERIDLAEVYNVPQIYAEVFVQLARVSLDCCSFATDTNFSTQLSTWSNSAYSRVLKRLELHRLKYRDVQHFVEKLLPSVTEVQELSIHIGDRSYEDVAVAKKILRLHSDTITAIEFPEPYNLDSNSPGIDISDIQNLRSVVFYLNFSYSPFDGVLFTLSTAKEDNKMYDITLCIVYSSFSQVVDSQLSGKWLSLDQMLSSISHFKQLRQVEVFILDDSREQDEETLREKMIIIRGLLPSVERMGILVSRH